MSLISTRLLPKRGGVDEKLFLYIDILGFSDIVENGERIDALFAEIDRLNVHIDKGFRTIVFSDTVRVPRRRRSAKD